MHSPQRRTVINVEISMILDRMYFQMTDALYSFTIYLVESLQPLDFLVYSSTFSGLSKVAEPQPPVAKLHPGSCERRNANVWDPVTTRPVR